MRHSKLTAEEALAAEKAIDDRKQTRLRGYSKMYERDTGRYRFSNGVEMQWHTAEPDFPDTGVWVYPPRVQEGTFHLVVDGKKLIFDVEEFRRQVRWA